MKRILVGGVLSALTAGAAAQGSVTLYGVADAAIDYVSAKGATAGPAADKPGTTRLSSQGSYWGIRGSEDLGGGLDAFFQLEGNFSIDSGASSTPFFNRDTFVGLRHRPVGALTLGVNTTSVRALGNALDLTPGANTGIGALQSLVSSMNGISTDHDSRLQNSVRYRSASFYGIEVGAQYGFGEVRADGTGRNDHVIGAGLAYARGPFYVAYAYEDRHDKNKAGLAQTNGHDQKHRVGVKYQVTERWLIGGLYDRSVSDGQFSNGDGRLRRDAWAFVTEYDWGAHEIYAMYGRANDVRCQGDTGGNGVNCGSSSQTGAQLWTLGYNYNLSKRTMIRTTISKILNQAAAKYDFSNGRTGAAAGADPFGASVGLRHRF
ncbi:Outer membrane protein (Porin) [Cupriavidus necator]|uniref:Outer membrane protein (Porin) n=1 Tax=Cupriavidus necator (strain ATCC 17699 / DSM 428 / KCTC 22496 / NCIMB 10442 / H16 / Stanier 337) TaxID=381666 RepID=Q0JYD4_CUPNH|nr:porin [Cupriavidus necator]QQB79693.1 porin [Cupriavidus necator]WKA43938.1 porin [Cupriavidus necator]CAJ97240.1 outer membrane protein (porin) [Cupriavidus necator H16]